jgi:hypothetical protein
MRIEGYDVATIAAFLSALGSMIASFAAVASWRTAKSVEKATEKQDMPILTGYYSPKDEKIYLINRGRGPALNISLQKNTLHYADDESMYEFKLGDDSIKNLFPGEEKPFSINMGLIKAKKGKNLSDAFAAFEYYFALGKQKYISILYSDIHQNRFVHKLKAVRSKEGSFELDILGTAPFHRVITPMVDNIDTLWFRSGLSKSFRERKYRSSKNN